MRAWDDPKNGGGGLGGDASGEDWRAGGDHAREDFCGLFRSFARRVDHLRQAVSDFAVMVDPRMSNVFIGQICQTSRCVFGGDSSTLHFGEEFEKGFAVHRVTAE